MREALGNQQLFFIFLRKDNGKNLTIGRSTLSQIHHHIQDITLQHANEFCLGIRGALVMQASQDAINRTGLVILQKGNVDARLLKRICIIAFKKIAAIIIKNFWLKDDQTGK